jgi:hypothetical protein
VCMKLRIKLTAAVVGICVKGGVKVDQWGGAKGSHLRAC